MLVDKEIKAFAQNGHLIISAYDEKNVNCISYDLFVEQILSNEKEFSTYDLQPGEIVFVQTKERISLPDDITAEVGEKNSKMRLGLKVDAPRYFPGHTTNIFLRVQNLSGNIIQICKNDSIAQMFFERLSQTPERNYAAQEGNSFEGEDKFRGLGNYKDEYEKRIRGKVEQAEQTIENVSGKIYLNVITLMGVLVAVFALLSIDYHAFTQAIVDFKFILTMNLTLVLCIVSIFGLIFCFFNRPKSKWFSIAYILLMLVLAIPTIILCIKIF